MSRSPRGVHGLPEASEGEGGSLNRSVNNLDELGKD